MADRDPTDPLNVRLPLYAYTAPLWRERRVLEIGSGEGASAAFLARHGAREVVSLDVDPAGLERARAQYGRPGIQFLLADDIQQVAARGPAFDVVLVPEGEAVLTNPGLVDRVRALLRDDGYLIVAVPASERQSAVFQGGVSYYDLSDALSQDFRVVRMLGQTPFLGFGLVEFGGESEALRVDLSLLGGSAEQPSHYIAVAGNITPPSLGQSLVQVPFAPIEALAEAAAGAAPESPGLARALDEANDEITRLKNEIAAARSAPRGASAGDVAMAATRAELAERRLEELERRARARADEADARISELRRKLEDALIQSESAVRVSRAQADEIEELRARLRRASEDRSLADVELGKLRRALAEADDSVLTLTRRTAEEMAVVAQRMVTNLGSGSAPSAAPSPELEAKLRRVEEDRKKADGQVTALTERLRATDEELRNAKQQTAGLASRDERIARLEGDKQDLLWRVAELEEKLRNAEQDASTRRETPEEILALRAARDRTVEEFHRAAAAHVNEVNRLNASAAEAAALVIELEDGLRAAEARAVAADQEAAALRRNAKELEEADRARRGRLSELEGKLLRMEREKAMAASAAVADGASAELQAKLQGLEQRLFAAEQRAQSAEQAASAAEGLRAEAEGAKRALADAQRAAEAAQRAGEDAQRAAEAAQQAADDVQREAQQRATLAEHTADQQRRRAELAEEQAAAALLRIAASEIHPPGAPAGRNGSGGIDIDIEEVRAVIDDAESRLRDEVRALGRIEDTLSRAEQHVAGAGRIDLVESERHLAARNAELAELRLELTRVRRDAESNRVELERELSQLRAKASAAASEVSSDQHLNAQLIIMHSTLANIRRRAARLRDELDGYRRRVDTLPPGALSSMLEEIGDDLGEFAK
jgi:chromosome segregation ATPase